MCDERERLIEYVYDDCDDGQRAEIDRHLDTCATCREEIAGLRATRQDLLAWEVPDHGSVWRPFAPPRLVPWYREVPAWAMAAAASLMFMIGVGGGITANALWPAAKPAAPQTASSQVQVPAIQTSADAAAMRAEFAALETRMMALVRANSTQFTQHVSGSAEQEAARNSSKLLAEQVGYVGDLSNLMWKKLRALEDRNRILEAQVVRLSAESAGSGTSSR